MNDKPKSKWYWRGLRWGLIALAILATLVAVLVTEENWRGKRDWEAYKHAAEARGDRLDWSFITPTNVPDDENFAKAPIFSSLMTMVWSEQTQDWKRGDTNAIDHLKMSVYRTDGTSPKGVGGSWEQARLSSLESWRDYYRNPETNGLNEFPITPQPQSPAADVLFALGKFDAGVEELRTASERPYSRFGGYSAYDERGFSLRMTYLSRFKGCAQVLQLRAVAELAGNQPVKALEDVKLLLRLHDELRQEPLLISHLVSLAIFSISLQPVYEGLAQHRWNDEQLAVLERALATKDFLADYQHAMRGERIFAIDTLENERITRKLKSVETVDGNTKVVTISLRMTPAAFFYQNELAFARLNEEFLQPLADPTNRIMAPAALSAARTRLEREMKNYLPYTIEAKMTFPVVSGSVRKFAAAESSLNLARIGCALERYRLAHKEYPAALDTLAPQFIETVPHDVINGKPLHYERTPDGRFVLYSVGWNETDDGGTVALNKTGSVDRDKGDWVWKY